MVEQVVVEQGWGSVENWLSRLGDVTAQDNRYIFRRFMKWLKENGGELAVLTPDELLVYQQEASNSERFKVLDLIQRFVNGLDLMAGSKRKMYNSLRSFFAHNRESLPRDSTFKIRSDRPPVKGKLNVDIFKKMVLASNECHQAVWVCLFQSGMGQDEFFRWNESGYDVLVQQLRGNPEQIRIDSTGRKQNKNMYEYYTFIGRDAITFIRKWLRKRGDAPGPIFTNQQGNAVNATSISHYWMRKLRRLGFVEKKSDYTGNRYGLNIHEIRDVFRSRWRLTEIDKDIAEFFMGHKDALDKLGYDKSPKHYPDFYEEKYHEAQPWLNVFTEDPQMVPAKELGSLRAEVARLRNGKDTEVEALETRVKELEERLVVALRNEEKAGKLEVGMEAILTRLAKLEEAKNQS